MKTITRLLALAILVLSISCSSDDDIEDLGGCGCVKTTYERLVMDGSLTIRPISREDVPCQPEGSENIDNVHYYTIGCD